MTVLEFWGCALITFGPALALFILTVAKDPIKVILLVSSSFFWLMSFLVVAICWAVINSFCDYLILGALLAVLSQEGFRYLFHIATKRAQLYLTAVICAEEDKNHAGRSGTQVPRTNEILANSGETSLDSPQNRIPMSYVSGLGFGFMNAAFSLMNVITDYIGPGTIGLRGDSSYFLLVSSFTALAFILLNVAWSILMSEGIEKSDRKLGLIVIITHLVATSITFVNKFHLQLLSMVVIYTLTIVCGLGAFKVAGIDSRKFLSIRSETDGTTQQTSR